MLLTNGNSILKVTAQFVNKQMSYIQQKLIKNVFNLREMLV